MKPILLYTILTIFSAFTLKAQTEVTFYTSKGNFVATMELFKRPITTTNFVDLVNNKFYDGIIFHRVVSGFVIQAGDPTGTGTGGSGVTIIDELTPVVSNVQKTISMANSGPNTGTSQFFINLVDNVFLNPNYPCFGTVISGFSVVQAIGLVPVDANDKPLTNVVMDSVRITKYPLAVHNTNRNLFQMEIFPNPVVEQSTLAIHVATKQTLSVIILNEIGLPVYNKPTNLEAGTNYISFNKMELNDCAKGIYHVIVKDENAKSQQVTIGIQ